MPVIKVQHVGSFSSEDPNHPADNLLNSETYRKWKCSSPGEKQAVVVLQFEKTTQIHSIDVGNDGSAFVEVLAGRSSAPDDYQVLLVTSTFMTPADSKGWSNTSRVRIFGKEKLSKGVADQKWDRVKIICTQPYNKTEKYGLAFVKFHSPPDPETGEDSSSAPSKSPVVKLGAFTLKEETKDLPPGSLFFRKEHPKPSQAPAASTAAQARMATAAALKADQSDSSKRKADQSDASMSDSKSRANTKETKRPTPISPKPGQKKKADDCHTSAAPPTKKMKASDDVTADATFGQIMKGVVFSLSGFKNPFRGDLREKAVEMGAQYEPDWSPRCTHLVCAFPNTPKFNQVKAKHGLIVKKEWVLDCHIKKRRLPAKKYRLSSGDGDSSSEDEFYDKREAEIFKKSESKAGGGRGEGRGEKTRDKIEKEATPTGVLPVAVGGDPYGGSTDEDSDMETDVVVKKKPIPPDEDSSGGDTEDEIQRIREQQKAREEEEDPYGGSTDEGSDEEAAKPKVPATAKKPLTDLPDFFSKCYVLLYGDFSPPDRRLIVRYVTAYNGHIEDYMSEKVTHVITQESWDNNFDQALSENSSLAFVRPKWIFACHKKQAYVPYQPFVVAPS